MTDRGIGIQTCLEGGRTREEHPAVPLTPEKLAADDAPVAAPVHRVDQE